MQSQERLAHRATLAMVILVSLLSFNWGPALAAQRLSAKSDSSLPPLPPYLTLQDPVDATPFLRNPLLSFSLPWQAESLTSRAQFDCSTATGIPQNQCEALVALYESTNGDNWTTNTGWLATNTPCSWYGVTCASGNVTQLSLLNNQLSGSIPPEIGDLTVLTDLMLFYNQLSGAIPPQIGNLSALWRLDLHSNQLSGPIPPNIGNLTALQHLDLSGNQLSSTIPPEIGNLTALTWLVLSGNDLSGLIPPEIGNLSVLWKLELGSNQLSGPILSQISNLTTLQYLDLGYNQLTGVIPPEIGNLTALTSLSLSSNQLTGTIPPQIGNLTALNSLYLDSNQLSGEIPLSITNLTDLSTWTSLGYNSLTSSNSTVIAFLNSIDPDWADTQTVPATNLVAASSGSSVLLTWTPITYTGDGGYYEISYANAVTGVYAVHGTTADKDASSYLVDGLSVGVPYYFRVRTYTPAHGYQQNALWSEYTIPVSATIPLLSITKDGPAWAEPGETITYTLTVYNHSAVTLTSLMVTDTLPTGATYLSGGVLMDNEVQWSAGSFDPSSSITFQFAVSATQTITNSFYSASTVGGHYTVGSQPVVTRVGNFCSFVTEIPRTECEALVALYESTNGDNWTTNTGWLATNTPCSWYGVTCASGNVTQLYLYNNQLSGSIPPEIGNLTSLWVLSLYNNQLSGAIPSEIGNLTALTWLFLHSNQLSGSIPSQVGNLTMLQSLRLSYNQLSGSIPSEIGNLTALTELYLWSNQLTGTIPSGIGNLTALTRLSLGYNELTGVIPPEIGNLTALQSLYLNNNQLTGTIPSEIGDLTMLTTLALSSNPLGGSIPPEIGNLTRLTYLELMGNQLSGTIPTEIGNLAALTNLNLYYNQLSGPIPPEIGDLSALTSLQLQWNELSGPIPPEIGNLTALTFINLATNELTGTIPAEIGNLTALTSLNLFSNQLSGPIPSEIGNLTALRNLRLEDNQLSGAVPSEIGNLTALKELHLYDNQLSGAIPPEMGNLAALEKLYLHNNLLVDEVPVALTALPLNTFFFHDTDLCVPSTGDMTTWLGGITNLYSTGLICNQALGRLSGTVTLTDTTPVVGVRVDLYRPLFDWPWASAPVYRHISTTQTTADGTYQFASLGQGLGIDYRVKFTASELGTEYYDNQSTINTATVITITPSIPRTGIDAVLEAFNFNCGNVSEIPQTECEALITLYESTNGDNWNDNTDWLATNMPCSWYGVTCSTDRVSDLWLSSNNLKGPIPPEIGNLTELWTLGLSRNQLTGTIPSEIGNLTTLTDLGLSRNQLTGPIPSEIGNLTLLRWLDLDNNQLSGAIPPEIGNLTALQYLYLNDNPLSGELPIFLTALTQLNYFTFYNTNGCAPSTGDVHTWLSGIPNLYGTGLICGQDLGSLSGTITLTDTLPAEGVQVNLYRSSVPWETWQHLTTTHTTADGTYQFTNLGQGLGIDYRVQFVDPTHQLAPQYYNAKPTIATAAVITITPGVPRVGIDAVLALPQPPAAGVETETGSVAYNPDGTAQITMPAPNPSDITVTRAVTCAVGAPSAVTLTLSTGPQYTMANVSSDLYRATIPAAALTGNATLAVIAACSDGTSTATVGYVTLYDPSGYVTDARTGEPVANAVVTLYNVPGWLPKTGPDDDRPNTCESNLSKVPDAPWSQPAPTELGIIANADVTPTTPDLPFQYTTVAGYYGWDVPEGCWYVTVEAEGYESLVSPMVGIPPVVTDLDLALTPLVACTPLTDVGIAGPLGITSTLYIDTLYTFQAVITPTDGTEPITYTWSPEPQTGEGTDIAAYRWSTPDTYTVTLTVENCGGPVTVARAFVLEHKEFFMVYLPLVLRN